MKRVHVRDYKKKQHISLAIDEDALQPKDILCIRYVIVENFGKSDQTLSIGLNTFLLPVCFTNSIKLTMRFHGSDWKKNN